MSKHLKILFITLIIMTVLISVSCNNDKSKSTKTETDSMNETDAPAVEEAETALPAEKEEQTQPVVQESEADKEEVAIEQEEEILGPIEYEGVMIPQITGLTFKEGVYYAQEGNPYGLEAEVKAGVFIKDAFELNGKMENSIGLRPEVIEFWQRKINLEEREIRFAIPFDLEKLEKAGVQFFEYEPDDDREEMEEKCWDKFTRLKIRVPRGTIVYSPLLTKITDEWTGCRINQSSGYCSIQLILSEQDLKYFYYKGDEKVHWANFYIKAQNCKEIIPDKDFETATIRTETVVGTPLVLIADDTTDQDLSSSFGGDFLVNLCFIFGQAEYNKEEERYEIVKKLETVKDVFIEIGGFKVFILGEHCLSEEALLELMGETPDRKLEINSRNVDDCFTAMTSEEIKNMEDSSKRTLVFPFNPRKAGEFTVNIDQCQVCQGMIDVIVFNIPSNVEIIAPFEGLRRWGASNFTENGATRALFGVWNINGSIEFSYVLDEAIQIDELNEFMPNYNLKIGDTIFTTMENKRSSKDFGLVTTFNSGNMVMVMMSPGESWNTPLTSINFDSFLKNEEGKIVYLSDS